MIDHPETFIYKLQFLFAGILIVASIFLLLFLLPPTENNKAQAKSTDSSGRTRAISMSDNPNVVAGGMAMAADELGRTMDSIGYTISSSTHSIASVVARSSRAIARNTHAGIVAATRGVGSGSASVGRAVGGGAAFVGRTIGKGAGFMFSIPGNILGAVSDTSVVADFIRPSDHVEVPIIDPNSPELRAALTALPPTKNPDSIARQGGSGPQWPMHGEVTTEFGVDHWPYQHTHSGIDISDMKPPGVTPIKPFRPGRVIDVMHSAYGLGNHVIVDHGNGVTSVYAHLNSISVQIGKEVGLKTILGYEGTTGVSTGTHLHFEIRVHGQAANPRQFIGSQL